MMHTELQSSWSETAASQRWSANLGISGRSSVCMRRVLCAHLLVMLLVSHGVSSAVRAFAVLHKISLILAERKHCPSALLLFVRSLLLWAYQTAKQKCVS